VTYLLGFFYMKSSTLLPLPFFDILEEEIRCIDRYVDIIKARVYKHEEIQAIAQAAEKPVINALCDLFRPCQALADLITIKEHKGKTAGLKIAYVGDEITADVIYSKFTGNFRCFTSAPLKQYNP